VSLLLRSPSYARDLLRNDGTATVTIDRDGQVETFAGFPVEWLTARTRRGSTPQRRNSPPPDPQLTSSLQPISTLFMACKATAVVEALQLLSSRLSAQSTVVFIQNGAGIVEAVIDNVFQDPSSRPSFLVGSTSHAGYRKGNGKLEMTWAAQGELMWAAIPSQPAAAALRAHGVPADSPLLDPHINLAPTLDDVPNLAQTRSLRATIVALLACKNLKPHWLSLNGFRTKQLQKIVGNAVINALTSILDVRNGQLPAQPHAQDIARQVSTEASAVFAAHVNQGTPFADDHLLHPDQLTAYVLQLAEKTKRNISSTLADLRNKTEVTELCVRRDQVHRN
jgi:2-dehydropantoate 2-reductase